MISGAILSGIGTLGSAIFGAIQSSKYARQAQKILGEQKKENRRWYNVKMAEDYTDRADVQRAIQKQRELLNEQYSNAAKTNVVAGGTDESLAMQKEAANKSVADATASVAAAGADYKDKVEQQYRQQDAALSQQQAQIKQQQAGAVAGAAGQAVSAGLNLMGDFINNAPKTEAPAENNEAKPDVVAVHNAVEANKNMKKVAAASTPQINVQIPTPAGVVKSAEQMAEERAKKKATV